MRMGPLIAIVLFVLLVGTTIGTTFLWVIAALSFIALITLIVVMSRAKRFIGPRILVDDVREKIDSYGREPVDEVVDVAPVVISKEDV